MIWHDVKMEVENGRGGWWLDHGPSHIRIGLVRLGEMKDGTMSWQPNASSLEIEKHTPASRYRYPSISLSRVW